MVEKANYILGIDVGVASLGVALLEVDEAGHPTGVRHGTAFIYPSGGEETAERRIARATRKRYQRRRRRLKEIRAFLCACLGAAPDFDLQRPSGNPCSTSRVALRARALAEPLPPTTWRAPSCISPATGECV